MSAPAPATAFDVRVLRPGTSAVETLRLEAGSEAELRARLSAAGDVVVGLKRASAAARGDAPTRGLGERRFDVGWWCRELRTLLLAGMTAVEAIETLAAGRHDAERARIHAMLLEALRQGKSLSKAMAATGAFPAVLVAGVTASERTSTLPAALEDFLRYDSLLRKLRQQLVSAAIYPAVVVTLGGAICLFLLLFVVPRFSRMYADLHGPVSGATEIVLWVSRAVQDRWPLLAAGAAGLAVAGLAAWRAGWIARAGMVIVDAVPLLARQWREFRLAKLYQALALMVKGGYAFDEALQVCAGLDGGARMAARVAEVRAA
ncbi:MAG TPA: type II secretion system F family protein, partial [Burkholderiaceae bacterium]